MQNELKNQGFTPAQITAILAIVSNPVQNAVAITLQDFAGFKIELISGNSKVGQSLNLLHGADWASTSRLKKVFKQLEKRAAKGGKAAQVLKNVKRLEKDLGLTFTGSCDKELISVCWKKGAGTCYCNSANGWVESNPVGFFSSWVRAMYFQLHPTSAWAMVANFVRSGGFTFKSPFRLFGQGDLPANQLKAFTAQMNGLQGMVSGFVRRPVVWGALLEAGFYLIAHSVDKSIVQRPHHFEAIKKIKETYGHKARTVLAPFNAKDMSEAELCDFTAFAGDFKFDVVIERHHGGQTNKETLAYVDTASPAAWVCPATRDKMAKRKGTRTRDPRACFTGCNKCHAGKGVSPATFAV